MITAAALVWLFFAVWLALDGQSPIRSALWPLHVAAAFIRKAR